MTFGRYEQDGDDANGPEPIEWIALEANSTTATLISVHDLFGLPGMIILKPLFDQRFPYNRIIHGTPRNMVNNDENLSAILMI